MPTVAEEDYAAKMATRFGIPQIRFEVDDK